VEHGGLQVVDVRLGRDSLAGCFRSPVKA